MKDMSVPCQQNSGQDHNIKDKELLNSQRVAILKYSVMTVTNEDYIHNEIKSIFNLRNAFYH
jgi:hypothetical protein